MEADLPSPEPRWCVVANVVEERSYGEDHQVRHGTTHFGPGAKVYVVGGFAGMCETVVVVGRHRGSKRYVRMAMKAAHLTDYRPKLAYSPEVLRLMQEREDGCVMIDGEADAHRWAEMLPSWRAPNHGHPRSSGRRQSLWEALKRMLRGTFKGRGQ